jgi:hypothetical protein
MKNSHKARGSHSRSETRNLTLGQLIASTYNACGEQEAPKLLQLALESNVVRLAQRQSFLF